jgi:hypothetical protein
MRAHWRREDYERAPRGAFNFTAEQAEQMRAKMNPSINVYVFNYAELSPKTLQRAEDVAAHILREAGVEAIWRNCDPNLTDIDHDVNCTQKASPTNLVLKILPDIAVTPGFTHDTTMGFAIGAFATVSFRQARKEAALMGTTADEILGLSAAHEIGHLLSQSHSDRGVMRPSWNREDFGVSQQGAFKFTPQQAKQIRAEVSTRNGIQQADAPHGMAAITLRVYDYAHLSPSTLLAAEGEATRILAQADVDARWELWLGPPADGDSPIRQSACQANSYVLQIMPKAMVAALQESPDSLGFTLLSDTGESVMSSVFYDRISKLSSGPRAATPVLLGRVMAHEIGHLLLGAKAHSPSGIMRAHWSDQDFSMGGRADLFFTAEQSRRMKTRLAQQARACEAQAKVVELGR